VREQPRSIAVFWTKNVTYSRYSSGDLRVALVIACSVTCPWFVGLKERENRAGGASANAKHHDGVRVEAMTKDGARVDS
jgi:hypothetical protein